MYNASTTANLLKKKKSGSGAGRVIGQNVAILPALIPVKIFTPAMKKALKDKGITPPKAPIDLIRSFYENIVKPSMPKAKKGSFESYYDDSIDPITGAAISGVVKAILDYFKRLKEKKKQAENEIAKGQAPTEPLTPAEEKLLKGAEQAVATGTEIAKEEAQFTIGKYVPWLIGGVAVFFGLKYLKVF